MDDIDPPLKKGEVNFKLLLAGLLIILLAGPVAQDLLGWQDPIIVRIVFAVSSVLFVASFTNDMRFLKLALIPAILMLISAILAVVYSSLVFYCILLASALAFCLLAVKYAAEDVFLSGSSNWNKIIGSVCIFLLLVVAWAIVYEALELMRPGSFSGLTDDIGVYHFDQFAYFSMVTITTLGYGDISPTSLISSALAGLEALVGVFYMAVLVASLVGDFMSRRGQ